MTRIRPILLLVLLAWCVPATARAQVTYGVRAGVSGDPTQFVFGGHLETKPLMPHLTFRPNLEVGVGDDQAVGTVNFEFAYWIPIEKKPVRLYVGAGPALIVGSEVSGGFNFLLGIQHAGGLFAEVKVGALDSPGVKLTFGYVFK